MATDLKRARERLDGERKRLVSELEQLMAAGRPSGERRDGSPFGKREEEATESQELERRLAVEGGIREQLTELEGALARVAAGTYGKCEVCGKPIEAARIEALPQARLCLTCKAAQARNVKTR